MKSASVAEIARLAGLGPERLSVHSKIEAAVIEDQGGLGTVRCQSPSRKTCGLERPLEPGQLADYLKNGWPRCCGHTMTWRTQREITEEKTR